MIEAAQLFLSLPLWVPVTFFMGALGGTVGAILLFFRSQKAIPAFLISLLAYIALFIFYTIYGVFRVAKEQIILMIVVVLVAGFFLWVAKSISPFITPNKTG